MDNTITVRFINRSAETAETSVIKLFREGAASGGGTDNKQAFLQFGLYSVGVGSELKNVKFRLLLRDADDRGKSEIILDSSVRQIRKESSGDSVIYYPVCSCGFIFASAHSGAVRIVIETAYGSYESDEVKIISVGRDKKAEAIKMAEVIREKQPELLRRAFRKSPVEAFLEKGADTAESTDTALALMNIVRRVYRREYAAIVRKKKYKLNERHNIDRLEKLTKISPQTITFIAMNPQYLNGTGNGRGIKYGGRTYLPEKTLITENRIDYDIYENRYIAAFLNMMISRCGNMKTRINRLIKTAERCRAQTKIKSKQQEFDSLIAKCGVQLSDIAVQKEDFRQLFLMYKTGFKFDGTERIEASLDRPKASAIFRQLPEYNVFFKEVFTRWFDEGMAVKTDDTDEDKDIFITAVSEPCTAYELYITAKWLEYFLSVGYEYVREKTQYAGADEISGSYSEKAYKFTLIRKCSESEASDSDCEEMTLYYSPSIFTPERGKDGKYTLSSEHADDFLIKASHSSPPRRGEDNGGSGYSVHYEPDFILRYRKGNRVRFTLADAKHKSYDEVIKNDMFDLISKYITDIIPTVYFHPEEKYDVKISGLCAVYSEHDRRPFPKNSESPDFQPYADLSAEAKPYKFKKLLYMNASDDDRDMWEEGFAEIIRLMTEYDY